MRLTRLYRETENSLSLETDDSCTKSYELVILPQIKKLFVKLWMSFVKLSSTDLERHALPRTLKTASLGTLEQNNKSQSNEVSTKVLKLSNFQVPQKLRDSLIMFYDTTLFLYVQYLCTKQLQKTTHNPPPFKFGGTRLKSK